MSALKDLIVDEINQNSKCRQAMKEVYSDLCTLKTHLRAAQERIGALEQRRRLYVSHDHGEMDYDAEKRAEVEGDRIEAERSCENCHTACRGHVLDPSTFVCNNWNPKQPREEKDDSKNSCLYVGGDCDRLKEKDEDIADLRARLAELAEAGTGYSQQTVDALTKEREALRARLAEADEENAELKRKLEGGDK